MLPVPARKVPLPELVTDRRHRRILGPFCRLLEGRTTRNNKERIIINSLTLDPLKVLVTGAGGAAAIAFLKAVSHLKGVEVHMADMDPCSTGLYLVRSDRRCLLPSGEAADFSDKLLEYCCKNKISVVVPTVDCELAPVAANRSRFYAEGIVLVLAPETTLRTCYDKYQLMRSLEGYILLADFCIYNRGFRSGHANYPMVLKPRVGSGSRGVQLIHRPDELASIAPDETYMLQEYLPGTEYSVDVYMAGCGGIVATVIRERMKVDSGIAVINKTVFDEEIRKMATSIASLVGLRYVSNIQFRRDRFGRPRLLEINPRFSGMMSLTVAAGVNMPELCLKDACGRAVPKKLDYELLAMVRN